MSQTQPRRPQPDFQSLRQEPIKYGDVFNVTGELASKPIAPLDASAMQSAETTVLGKTRKSGPGAVMQSAATANEIAGLVPHDKTDITGAEGVTVTRSAAEGEVWVTESVEGQVVGKYIHPEVPKVTSTAAADPITIGEALETAALSAADKPIDRSDVAAIQAAEKRATGMNETIPAGVAAAAQCAAARNARTMRFEDKATLSDVLSDASSMLGTLLENRAKTTTRDIPSLHQNDGISRSSTISTEKKVREKREYQSTQIRQDITFHHF